MHIVSLPILVAILSQLLFQNVFHDKSNTLPCVYYISLGINLLILKLWK